MLALQEAPKSGDKPLAIPDADLFSINMLKGIKMRSQEMALQLRNPVNVDDLLTVLSIMAPSCNNFFSQGTQGFLTVSQIMHSQDELKKGNFGESFDLKKINNTKLTELIKNAMATQFSFYPVNPSLANYAASLQVGLYDWLPDRLRITARQLTYDSDEVPFLDDTYKAAANLTKAPEYANFWQQIVDVVPQERRILTDSPIIIARPPQMAVTESWNVKVTTGFDRAAEQRRARLLRNS